MKRDPLVYIIMRNHNSCKFTKESIESLQKMQYPNFKILVVDDGSTDDSYLKLHYTFPNVEFILTHKYLEYCKSLNQGIRYALNYNASFVFLVNNDTKDFSKDYLDKVLQAFNKDKNIGMVGTVCHDYDGKVRHDCKRVKIRFGHHMPVPTEGYVISRETIETVGYLDEQLVRYFEDVDYIIRMKEKGFKIVCLPDVSFKHYGGGTSSSQHYIRNFYRVRNMVWFIKRYSSKTFSGKLLLFLSAFRLHFYRMFSRHFIIVSYANIKGMVHGVLVEWKK